MFAPLTTRDENRILSMHLTSGWYKQAPSTPTLSEPWRETEALLDRPQRSAPRQLPGPATPAGIPASAEPEQREPEAGQ